MNARYDYMNAGASIPLSQWCISPYCRFPPLFRMSNFYKKIFMFQTVIDSEFVIFLNFSPISPQMANATFAPISRNLLCSPTLVNFPLISLNLRVFAYFTCFVSPYFDRDAFMHHTMHVLDDPAWMRINWGLLLSFPVLDLRFGMVAYIYTQARCCVRPSAQNAFSNYLNVTY